MRARHTSMTKPPSRLPTVGSEDIGKQPLWLCHGKGGERSPERFDAGEEAGEEDGSYEHEERTLTMKRV